MLTPEPALTALRDELAADAARDTRIHAWIASQYYFALSEADPTDDLFRSARRDSAALPPALDLLAPAPASYDPLFGPAVGASPHDDKEREAALHFLVNEMNTWRVNYDKDLPATPEDDDSPPSSPATPTFADFPSPPTTPTTAPCPLTPARRRPSLPLLASSSSFCSLASSPASPDISSPTIPPPPDPEPEQRVLTTSASYASLRQRAARFPSISTTLSASSSRNATYGPPPPPTPPSPSTPSTPTPALFSPTPTSPTPTSPMTACFSPTPTSPSTACFSPTSTVLFTPTSSVFTNVDPHRLGVCVGAEASRWSVASSSRETPTLPPTVRAQSKQDAGSIRTRLLSTFGLKSSPKRSKPAAPTDTKNARAKEDMFAAFELARNRQSYDVKDVEVNPFDASTPHLSLPPSIEYPSPRRSWTGRKRAVSGLSARDRHKRLVVSGLRSGDMRAEEAVRRWCEEFGTVRRVSRREDGTLHVSFKKAEVADRVCRLQAQVFIKGVGDVGLSWVAESRMF